VRMPSGGQSQRNSSLAISEFFLPTHSGRRKTKFFSFRRKMVSTELEGKISRRPPAEELLNKGVLVSDSSVRYSLLVDKIVRVQRGFKAGPAQLLLGLEGVTE
jgi:hypothetical protein